VIVKLPAIESVFHDSQREVYRNLARFSVLEIGRRWGKTTFGHVVAQYEAIAGKKVGWFAPSYKYLADPVRGFEKSLGRLIRSHDRMEKRMTLRTGGTIDFWSLEGKGGEDAGRGRDYDLIVFDEAGFVPVLLRNWREATRATLTDRKGRALFLGTPKGTGDFHRLFLEAESDTTGQMRAFRVGSARNPFLDPDEIEAARRMLPTEVFMQEYEGVPAEDGGNPFGLDAIRSCIGPLSDGKPECWGVDLAKSQDWTVAIALDADGAVCRAERWQSPWHVTRERLARMIGDLPAQIDSTGVGDPIVEDLKRVCRRVEGYKFTSQTKQQLMEGLQIAIQTKEIRFPDGWLRNELEAFGFRYSGRGAVQYEATAGHDDGVCALSLALMSRRAKKPLILKVI
jgi:hypothetical protein